VQPLQFVQLSTVADTSDSSHTQAESLSNTLNKALALFSSYAFHWQKSLNLFNQVSASSAVVPCNGVGFKLSMLISESKPLSTSSVSCTGGNGDDDGSLLGAEGPAVMYVTETGYCCRNSRSRNYSRNSCCQASCCHRSCYSRGCLVSSCDTVSYRYTQ